MEHGTLHKFDPKKESIEYFHEHFEFYCVANGIQGDNKNKKAMFIMLLGQETFKSFKTEALRLVSNVQLVKQIFT